MARSRRNWGTLKGLIYGHLEEEAADSHWEPDYVLDVANEVKDEMEMELHQKSEGFSVEVYTTDIAVNQQYFSIPDNVGRISNVYRIFPELQREMPLLRAERRSTPTFTTGTGKLSVPSFRVVNNQIKIEPPSGEAITGGLKIEIESASELLLNDASTMPLDWPIHSELLLVMRTTKACFDDERAQDDAGEQRELSTGFGYRLRRIEGTWREYISDRSGGRQFAVPYRQGA